MQSGCRGGAHLNGPFFSFALKTVFKKNLVIVGRHTKTISSLILEYVYLFRLFRLFFVVQLFEHIVFNCLDKCCRSVSCVLAVCQNPQRVCHVCAFVWLGFQLRGVSFCSTSSATVWQVEHVGVDDTALG